MVCRGRKTCVASTTSSTVDEEKHRRIRGAQFSKPHDQSQVGRSILDAHEAMNASQALESLGKGRYQQQTGTVTGPHPG